MAYLRTVSGALTVELVEGVHPGTGGERPAGLPVRSVLRLLPEGEPPCSPPAPSPSSC